MVQLVVVKIPNLVIFDPVFSYSYHIAETTPIFSRKKQETKKSAVSTYTYAFNDPVYWNDPLGDDPCPSCPQESPDYRMDPGGGGLAGMEFSLASLYVGARNSGIDFGGGRRGIGSGNHWTDGIGNMDWSANVGSETYRNEMAIAKDIGGYEFGGDFYTPDGTLITTRNGESGVWVDYFTNGIEKEEYYIGSEFKPIENDEFTPRRWDSNPYGGLAEGDPSTWGLSLAYDLGTFAEHLWAMLNEEPDPSLTTGVGPEFIGGPLRKGQKAIKLGKHLFNPQFFHRTFKPDVLKRAGDFAKIVGKNPDIGLDGTKIILKGARNGPYKGKTFQTGLDIWDFIF